MKNKLEEYETLLKHYKLSDGTALDKKEWKIATNSIFSDQENPLIQTLLIPLLSGNS